MIGIRYLKVAPTNYVIQYKKGQIVREGAGLSFFYFAPSSVLVSIPVGSADVPFIFNEVTADFQNATIQGELTFRVTDAKQLASLLDYSLDGYGRYASDDPDKLKERMIHAVQILARSFTQRHVLGDLLVSSDALVAEVLTGLRESEAVAMLGVEVLGLSILGIRSEPEMAKALEAEAREEMLRQADQAIYTRRNAAVEQERKIKENELNTEIVVEQKRRQVRETKMQAEIAIEQQRTSLVDHRVENETKESKARAEILRAMLEPVKDVDWRTLMAVGSGGLDAKKVMAMAFRDIADNAGKIGQLNITPDLLSELLGQETESSKQEVQPRRREAKGR